MKNELQKNWMADDEYEYYNNSTFGDLWLDRKNEMIFDNGTHYIKYEKIFNKLGVPYIAITECIPKNGMKLFEVAGVAVKNSPPHRYYILARTAKEAKALYKKLLMWKATFCEEISMDSEIAAKILKNWAKMATI